MSKLHVFISFDLEHDEDLYAPLVEQSRTPSSGSAVLGGSKRSTTAYLAAESVRRQIREANQVIVICGEHTEASAWVGAELLVAQEERTPFLLWGRRDSMCTKPHGAKTAEGMYSWTRQILQDQITFTTRKAAADAAAATLRDAHAKR